MKTIFYILLFCSISTISLAQKNNCNAIIGFQTGISAPFSTHDFSLPKFKIGLPSFSYAASIEKRFTIKNKLNFSLQYSITFFKILQQNLNVNRIKNEQDKLTQHEITNSISLNNIYKLKDNFNFVSGIGMSTPLQFQTMNENKNYENITQKNKKFSPILNPFFMVGIENKCTIFRKSLILSLQYNIGFMPYRNQPMINNASNNENQYIQSISIGLKYMY